MPPGRSGSWVTPHPGGDCQTPATDWILNLRYVDRLERRNGTWRIADRVLVCESERTDVVGGEHAILGPDWHAGTRDRTDASYRRARPSDSV